VSGDNEQKKEGFQREDDNFWSLDHPASITVELETTYSYSRNTHKDASGCGS
jgi:hypothetical protein